ncbi:MAG: Holliday junction resolvase RuvX [Actinomycetota bacterium]
MPEGRVLALDLGEARIGVALSDPDRRVALPHGTIRVAGGVEDLKAVASLVREAGAVEIVVGHPLGLSGERGAAAERAEAFAQGLRLVLEGVPVHLQDERLSTVEAERGLREAGARRRGIHRRVDQAAAGVILEGWLARTRGRES